MFKQQSDTHKLLTIAAAALFSIILFVGGIYAFYWDEHRQPNIHGAGSPPPAKQDEGHH